MTKDELRETLHREMLFTTLHSESLGSKSARASRSLVPFGGRCSPTPTAVFLAR